MAEGGFIHIIIEHGGRKCMIPFRSEDQFLKKCQERFNLSQDKEIVFTVPGDDIEIDLDCIQDYSDGTILQLKQADNNNSNQDESGFSSTMSCMSTDETSNEDGVLAEDEFGSDQYFRDVQWFKWDDDRALKDHLSKHGSKNIASLLHDSLEGLRRQPINIAIIGQSGKGKSSLINALRGITEVDVGGAEVGERETTNKCTPYKHPQYENIVYWDLPGCGTVGFSESKYLKKIKYRLYDFFLIVSSDRFYKADIWLAKRLTRVGQTHKCYIVRSKVDIDMTNRLRRYQLQNNMLSKSKIFENLKVEVETDIMKALGGKFSIKLFLLSSHYPEEYEFPNLQLWLLEKSTEKRLSLAFGTKGLSKRVLDCKKRALRSRQEMVSYEASFHIQSIPIDLNDCIPIIILELELYKEQLSLDETGLKAVARTAGITVNALKLKVNLERDQTHDEILQSLDKLPKKTPIKGHALLCLLTDELDKARLSVAHTICYFLDKTLLTYLEESKKLIECVKTTHDVL